MPTTDRLRLYAFDCGSLVATDVPVGHQMLLLGLPETGRVVLAGDLSYAEADRATRRVAAWGHDIGQTRRSMERIEGVVAARSARLVIGHDRASLAALPPGSAFLS